MVWAMRKLEIRIPVIYLSDLPVRGSRTQRLVEACQAVNATTYISGVGGKNYMDLEQFSAANIEVIWQEFTPPTYSQLFPEVDFIPNLSILDVLFCCGPESRNFLDEQANVTEALATA